MRRRTASSAAAVSVVLLVAGCSGSSGTGAASPAPTPSASPVAAPALPSCRPAASKPYTWPKPVPADLPKLPGATLGETKQTKDGLTIVRFSTRTSLRDGVLFIVRNLPPAGYVLGRGDAEPTEADAPFNKGDLRGVLRGVSREVCATEWLLAVTRGRPGGAPATRCCRRTAAPRPRPCRSADQPIASGRWTPA
jgi:hypothetical protein